MAAARGKGKKIGRGQRKKSFIRYKAEGRAAINKEKKRLKQEKIEEKHALKKAAREQERLRLKDE